MPAELRQVGRNLVPGGGSVSGAGGGGRGAGPPGGHAFVCGAAGRRQLLSAPPGPVPGVGAEWTRRRGCGERAGAGAMEAGGPRAHPRPAPRTGAWDRVVGRASRSGTSAAGGRPRSERAARLGLPHVPRAPARGGEEQGPRRSFGILMEAGLPRHCTWSEGWGPALPTCGGRGGVLRAPAEGTLAQSVWGGALPGTETEAEGRGKRWVWTPAQLDD